MRKTKTFQEHGMRTGILGELFVFTLRFVSES